MYAFILFSYVWVGIIFFHHRMDLDIPVYELKIPACFLRCASFILGACKVIQENKIHVHSVTLKKRKINKTNKRELSNDLLHLCQSAFALLNA